MNETTRLDPGDVEPFLLEVDADTATNAGIAKTGLTEAASKILVSGEELFRSALARAVKSNVSAFQDAISSLDQCPTDVEISFGIKVTADLGSIIISKVGSEANYSIKLTWKDFKKNP